MGHLGQTIAACYADNLESLAILGWLSRCILGELSLEVVRRHGDKNAPSFVDCFLDPGN